MLRPSYTELMKVLNDQQNVDNKITSRYTIVIAAAKRARKLIDGKPALISDVPTDKAVSIAVSEMQAGKILISDVKDENENNSSATFGANVEIEGLGVMN